MLESLLPHYTYRRLVVRLAYNWLRGHDSLVPRLNRRNFERFRQCRKARLSCNVCGAVGEPFFDFPDLKLRRDHRIGELRETLQCNNCGATVRHRTLVHAFLQVASEKSERILDTLKEASRVGLGDLRILDTDAFSATSRMLRSQAGYIASSFEPGKPLNTLIGQNHYNIDLERIGFDDDSFDIVLTSDVMEHVRDIESAHREIARILKPGGCYVFTVPYDPDCPSHHVLVDTVGEQDRYLVPPQYHGDPLTGGILAYRVFGRALFADLEKLDLSVEFRTINQPAALIAGGDVFVATKGGTAHA